MIMKTSPSLFIIASMLLSGLTVLPCAAGEDPAVLQARVDDGDAEAMFKLGRACLHGDGVRKDLKKSFELMSAAAGKGHADAMGAVGYFHANGLVVSKDAEEAAHWFRKGAEKGSAKARLNLGKDLLKRSEGSGGDSAALREEGLRWIRMAADQGLPEAAYSYGLIFYFGDHGLNQDYKLASAYLKTAAEAGNPDARNILGAIHENGQGTEVNEEEAKRWYRLAAFQGHAKAQANLGRLTGPTLQDSESRVEALAWLILAASQNEITAVKLLRDVPPSLKPGDMDKAKERAALYWAKVSKPGN